jgi:hypothetical protein
MVFNTVLGSEVRNDRDTTSFVQSFFSATNRASSIRVNRQRHRHAEDVYCTVFLVSTNSYLIAKSCGIPGPAVCHVHRNDDCVLYFYSCHATLPSPVVQSDQGWTFSSHPSKSKSIIQRVPAVYLHLALFDRTDASLRHERGGEPGPLLIHAGLNSLIAAVSDSRTSHTNRESPALLLVPCQGLVLTSLNPRRL